MARLTDQRGVRLVDESRRQRAAARADQKRAARGRRAGSRAALRIRSRWWRRRWRGKRRIAFGRAPVGGGGGGGGFGGFGGAPPVSTGDYLVTITVDGKTLSRVLRVERGR